MVEGVLTGDLFREPGSEGERFEGVVSLVVPEPSGGIHPLPRLHFGRREVFADRSLEKVTRRLHHLARTIIEASTRPTYLLQPCRYGDQMGLYAKDFFNRSKSRFELKREGFVFSEDSFVRLVGDGAMECADWGRFKPRFVIFNVSPESSEVEISRGRIVFMLTSFKLGSTTPWDIMQLQQVSKSSIPIPAVDAAFVKTRLEEERV